MLKQNLDKIFEQISGGNNLGEKITLCGATKMVDVSVINQAIEYGLEVVAENKVQEFNPKHEHIRGAKQHFIGHLQTNKVKYLVGKVELIHSVDSIHLAEAIDKQAKKIDVNQDILIEINVGGELSKSGFEFNNIKEQIAFIKNNFSSVSIKGLMAMLPMSEDEEYKINLCKKMRALFDELKTFGYDMQYLSMGMSGDYQIAIKNGSNMIRLGSSIFGKRNYGEI
jgi:pyridoxal phosphate enzyme (YggS family)